MPQGRLKNPCAVTRTRLSQINKEILKKNEIKRIRVSVFKLDLEKAGEPEIKLPTSTGSSKKQENPRKTSTSASLTVPKPLTVDHNKLWKILKRDETTRSPDLPPEKSVCRSRSNN